MNDEQALIRAFSLGGFRSFGRTQKFERFAKINLLIGPNNCGKSNVLRFIQRIYPKLGRRDSLALQQLDRHFPNSTDFRCGLRVSLALDPESRGYAAFKDFVGPLLSESQMGLAGQVVRVFKAKAELEKAEDLWFEFNEGRNLVMDNWKTAFDTLNDRELYQLWNALTRQTGGSREQHWFPESLGRLTPNWTAVRVEMIPAVRRIGAKGSEAQDFGGEGIIERLARLQNPDVHRQSDKESFGKINRFLKSVTDNDSAEIEIPYERDTINVHMDGKSLPLDSLGTGIHEVIILAAASTILQGTVVCMEEPELHLNPVLQKKFVRYLASATDNQYFITTHSAALMDTAGAEVYHVHLENGQSTVDRVTSDRHRSTVCEDLGYHPSDLLQANCIVWVEGPSDRVYLNSWIRKRAPELKEGMHYSIMFYGGRLASHLTGLDLDQAVDDFISLRRLNRRAVILMDSDRKTSKADLNTTKKRLIAEFDSGPGHAWVTAGREIENYLPAETVRTAIAALMPKAQPRSRFGRFDKALEVRASPGEIRQVPKMEVAKYIAANFEPDEDRLDLRARLDLLMEFIRSSNPRQIHVAA